MVIKPAKYKKEKRVVTVRVSEEIHGCDNCKKEIDFNNPKIQSLELTVFRHQYNTQSERLIFCSWSCVLEKLPKIKTDYFVSLPYLMFDTNHKGVSAKDFIKEIRKNK
jgi:hypothetical protein